MAKDTYHTLDNVMRIKEDKINWSEAWVKAFSNPSACGMWFVFGNSANGKSNFCMQLAKELARKLKVLYVPLEEEYTSTFQKLVKQAGLFEVKSNVVFIRKASPASLNEKLKKRRSPKVIIVDSVQSFTRKYAEIEKLVNDHPDKLFIFISQVEGKKERGSCATDVRFYASQKIWIEGFIAHSLGRYNQGGKYIIWEEGATKYWGSKK